VRISTAPVAARVHGRRDEPPDPSAWVLVVIAACAVAISTGALAGIGVVCALESAAFGVAGSPVAIESLALIGLGIAGAAAAAIAGELSGWRGGAVAPWLVTVPFSSIAFAFTVIVVPALLIRHATALPWLGVAWLAVSVVVARVRCRVSRR
jgi:hypothetical protein